MRRFQSFCKELFATSSLEEFELSEEVTAMLTAIVNVFDSHLALLKNTFSDHDRKTVLDGLGKAGSVYRTMTYNNGFTGNKTTVSKTELLHFFEVSLQYIDHSIRANRRSDGLYHAYNLMTLKSDSEVSISHLYEMLEGQVAVLSSGLLSPEESLEVLKALRASSLFRENQHSYILYPDRQLPRFLDKNNIPKEDAARSELIAKLTADNNRLLVERDVLGHYHFNGNIRNAGDVKTILAQLKKSGYELLVEKEQPFILDVFEKIFDHKSFTGRSGTFFGYEGLGSIYWHMVSKLLLAAQEACLWAMEQNADAATVKQLIERYYDVRAGIGFNKKPDEYGAFPSDPYSHTPGNAGAQQPGMTGQVKEDILARFGELGVLVKEGQIIFRPSLLRKTEFITAPTDFPYFDLNSQMHWVKLPAQSLSFTYCQVPVVYHLSEKSSIQLTFANGQEQKIEGLELDAVNSAKIFGRTGEILRVDVSLMPAL